MVGVIGVAGAVGGLGAFILREVSVRRQAKRVTGEEVAYILSDEGVEFTSSTTHSKLPWRYFEKSRIDDRGLVLYTRDSTYSFVPARAFAAERFRPEEMKAFLAAKLKMYNRGTKPHAGSRPSPDVSSASESTSSPGPRR